jgi:hypothetical protein
MPDYSKSIIYKIYDNTNGDVYYGSTCNTLRYRISTHKCDVKSDKKYPCKSQSIILNGDYTYSVVEKYPCETKLELKTRERWWIENNVCVNKHIPLRTNKEYYNDNADKIKEQQKLWYADNVDKVKEYRIENKDKITEQRKQYRIDNADKLKEKVKCDCGGCYTQTNKARHLKTKKHKNYINSQTATCVECVSN